jgi:hypothetical protein
MGHYVSVFDYEGDIQVAMQHGMIENGQVWVDDDE